MTGIPLHCQNHRTDDLLLVDQLEAMDKLRVSPAEPGRLVVDAGELVATGVEPRFWHLTGDHAGTWLHTESGACGPLADAGGYHVAGTGARFIGSVAGSPSNGAGLPLRLLLRRFQFARALRLRPALLLRQQAGGCAFPVALVAEPDELVF